MYKKVRIMMKRFLIGLLLLSFIFSLAGCGSGNITPDYEDAASFEAALNAGENLIGKTVKITVNTLVPDSAFGYNIQTGEHLNFCSEKNPNVSEGDTLIVEVTDVSSVLGSYIILYEKK